MFIIGKRCSLTLSLSLSLSNFPSALKERGANKGTSGKEVKLIPVPLGMKKKKTWTLSQTSIDAFFLNSHCSAFSLFTLFSLIHIIFPFIMSIGDHKYLSVSKISLFIT